MQPQEAPKYTFNAGDLVSITDGPYKLTIWPTFEGLDDKDPSMAIVSTDTGRQHKVKVPLDNLEPRKG